MVYSKASRSRLFLEENKLVLRALYSKIQKR